MVERRPSLPLDGSRKEKARLILHNILFARRIRDILEGERLPEERLPEECPPKILLKTFFSTLANLKDLGISLEQAKRIISPLTQLDKPTMPDANRKELIRVKKIQGERIRAILQKPAISTNVSNGNFFFIKPSTLEKILEDIGEDLKTLALPTNGERRATGVIPLPKRTGK